MSERKLASIRTIKDIRPIEGADVIELAIVDGWQCVTKKGEFKPGDTAVYFEIDSVLPIQPEYEFLRKGCYKRADWLPNNEGFRIKTIKLRGQISQGLVLPLGSLLVNPDEVKIGDDVTDRLGVVKWDPPLPACLQGLARGLYPSFIQKTDQERVQNCWDVVRPTPGWFEVTIKLDGASCTIYHCNNDVGVCSRNLNLMLEGNDGNTFVRYAKESGMLEALPGMGNIAIQGEMMGPGIQGNREGLTKADMFIFDVYLIDAKRHATPSERSIILNTLKDRIKVPLRTVPFLFYIALDQFTSAADVLKIAEGKSLTNPVREGIVFKSCQMSNGKVVSFKAISNAFLYGMRD